MDLLTTVIHGQGHRLGFNDPDFETKDVMRETLEAGKQRTHHDP